jgi:hypothetical protein
VLHLIYIKKYLIDALSFERNRDVGGSQRVKWLLQNFDELQDTGCEGTMMEKQFTKGEFDLETIGVWLPLVNDQIQNIYYDNLFT